MPRAPILPPHSPPLAHALPRSFLPLLLTFAACHTSPPRPWLRYEAAGEHDWRTVEPGRLATELLGTAVTVDLHRRDTQIRLEVVNTTGADVALRVGPEAMDQPTAAIGELQRRRVDGRRGEDGSSDFVPYVARQSAELRTGFRATFHLDNVLGRPPVLGQYLVLSLEVRGPDGRFERRLLPLVATNAGTTTG